MLTENAMSGHKHVNELNLSACIITSYNCRSTRNYRGSEEVGSPEVSIIKTEKLNHSLMRNDFQQRSKYSRIHYETPLLQGLQNRWDELACLFTDSQLAL